ncbi:MAG TPA: efflux RND transporter periplasmic adaptor subunit [Candidatus Dormibacteraeota bacterium]|nr:efflux RND transporter periplasmic adaptor subunit [Candidatus Dormibacteraeota bacterium]
MGGIKNLAAMSLLAVMFVAGCGDTSGAGQTSSASGALSRPQSTSAVPVVAAKVQRTSIPIELHAIGTGQAFKTVSVESQVAGIIKAVSYRPGGLVHQGDLLLKLDDAPYLATLSQDQAALARDKAQDQLDRAEVARYNELYRDGVVSKEQYDQYQATSSSAVATVASDEAAIQGAKIQLSYCSIYAPISGVTGAQLVYPGATVSANSAPVLVVINQISPLYVAFSVPQQYLGPIKLAMDRSRLAVQATPPDSTIPENGYLSFVNNTVDANTGTIELMGTFSNADHRLWPGQYSNVHLRLGERQNVIVVPSQALQSGQQGDFVFVVEPNMTVAVRQVKVGETINNQAQILQGLSTGETVVADGQVNLAPGTKVYFTKAI